MTWEFELVAGPYGETTEGPAWDGQVLLFTHIIESRILRYDPRSGACSEHRTGTNHTNGLAFDSNTEKQSSRRYSESGHVGRP